MEDGGLDKGPCTFSLWFAAYVHSEAPFLRNVREVYTCPRTSNTYHRPFFAVWETVEVQLAHEVATVLFVHYAPRI